jgi:hypothetical protein
MSYDKERYACDPAYRARLQAVRKARAQVRRTTEPDLADALRSGRLQRVYGITLEEYHAMVARQDGLCPLCERRPVEKLCLDHCHDMQMLRLLLCQGCNMGLGKFGHDPARLRRAADYIEIWRIIHARKGPPAKRIRNWPSKPRKKKETKCPTLSSPKTPKQRSTKKPRPRE